MADRQQSNGGHPSSQRTTYFQNNQDFRMGMNSNLTPTASEFFPRNYQSGENGEEANGSNGNNNERGTTFFQDNNWRSGNDYGRNNGRNTGAIRKHYDNRTNNYHNNHRSATSSDQQQYYNNNHNGNHPNHPSYRKQPVQQHQETETPKPEVVIHPDFKSNRNLKTVEVKDTSRCSQREKLIQEIDSGKLECMVCCEKIKPFQPIWSCTKCFHIFNLSCITKWALSSKSEDGWRCPACNALSERIPRDYYCFCGKLRNPQYNRNDVAHSCGDLCEKREQCEHACKLLCHPGPCPPCQIIVTRICGCGKSKKSFQCCQKLETFCAQVCDKPLACGVHFCQQICHIDDCAACDQQMEQVCFCGKERRSVECTADNNAAEFYSCDKKCEKPYDCGNHKCEGVCHPGDCGGCKLAPEMITSCPCGKSPIPKHQRKNCLEPIPVCKEICGKLLKCGPPNAPHTCPKNCHIGECPPCSKKTKVKCRCGHMDQEMKCKSLKTRADDARCKKKCTKFRNCGKHKCNQECCIDIDHICQMKCSRTLSCGKHKCDQQCHNTLCKPCHRTSFYELHCECGAETIFPPVPCGTKKPPCKLPCKRQHPCNHPVLHSCHADATCPPCVVLTTQWCYGRHEQRKTIPCEQKSFSCGMPCKQPLTCKRHKCIRPCHEGSCLADNEACKQKCTKPRLDCDHPCSAPCHDGICPDLPCKHMVEVTCECGHRKQSRACFDFSRDYRRITTAQLAMSMQEMQNGGSVELSEILGTNKKKNTKALECTEECKVIERNRRIAIGLQIRNPDLNAKLQPNYSEFLKGWGRKDPQFVTRIHDKLTELVKLAKESKQRSRSHSFPTMNREKRQVVHELCGMFGVQSEAYDAEPNRNVVATAKKEETWLPPMSLMEVLSRENGQRKVPLPNYNAWGLKK